MEKKQIKERYKGIICSAGYQENDRWSQVKQSSVDNLAPSWKDGRLHIAQSHTDSFLLVVEYRNGIQKAFPLNVKSRTYTPSNKTRAMILLKDGTAVHINKAPAPSLERMIDAIDALGKKGKTTGISSHLNSKPQVNKTSPPWLKEVISPQKPKPSREQSLTPGRSRTGDREEFTGVKTPTFHQKSYSPWKSIKRKTPDDEVLEVGDGEDTENLGASMLFSDQTDKENRYTPTPCRGQGQSVLQKRMKSGGSIFLESFEEKQKGMSENKKKGPNSAIAVSHNFYSRGRQMSNYGTSDLFSRTPSLSSSSQSEEPGKKTTPGFLVSRSNNVPRSKFNFKTWNKPSGMESSQRNLQGFSNLGNTCYMNAILQSLLGLQCFIQDLQHLPLIKVLPKSSLYRALSRLLYSKQGNKGSAEIELRLQSVKAAISATATRFSGFMQHDAHEFLCQCLDQLKEDVEKVNNPKTDKDIQEAVSPPSQVVPSNQSEDKPKFACAVSQNFELEVEHSILCQECGEEISKKETFNDLSLDLPRTCEPFSLQTALDSFCASEKLEYACAKCDWKEAKVCHKFTKLPRVLILHLKRYTYDSDASSDSKLRSSVVIPRFLTLAFHTTRNTAPPPARSNHTQAYHVLVFLNRNRIAKQIVRKGKEGHTFLSGFKFNRGRLASDSAKKGSEHFISRFETDIQDSSKSDKSNNENFIEMDEEEQLARALELSRQEAEASLKRKPDEVAVDEFTDEELAKALNDSMEAEERREKSKEEEQDSDDDLPVGLIEDPELSDMERVLYLSKKSHQEEHGLNEDAGLTDLERALHLSKRTHEEELKRQGAFNGEGPLGTLTNGGLLGGARRKFAGKSTTWGSEKCNWMGNEGYSCKREGGKYAGRAPGKEDGDLVQEGNGLLGGAKRYQQQRSVFAKDEPMDTEDDQPIAFSLDSTSDEDPTQPSMWDSDTNQIAQKLKELSRLHASHILPPRESSPDIVNLVSSDDDILHHPGKVSGKSTDDVDSSKTPNKVSATSVDDSNLSKTPDHRTEGLVNTSSHHQTSSCSKPRSILNSPSTNVPNSETKFNRNGKSLEGNRADLWKPYNNLKKNIFQQFPSSDETRADEEKKDDDDDGGDGILGEVKEERKLSYDEMKAKEEEDIRKATELSMQEVKDISEREAAEILRAQEMSLQDLHERQGMTPNKTQDRDDSKPSSPVYSKEETEMLSKHSELGHLNNAYRLVSIVSHIGSTSMTGHYISDVYDVEKKCWLSYDDSTVMKRDERSLREERRRTGYIFFYHAKEFL
ncbi:ubiquitin carboxyl-terminal hydrolase 37-like [Lytechinus variegatus]|uniref:ubiquitin carboxyl-terminal hydrolase 37-like n=1 Tax=Lytechinus variegatus TaxID=7654 RepID=UPI001BB1E264|nr:ubiquitin carboxyl-terminal hydrolase 37-like [Lytechinus variegatus]